MALTAVTLLAGLALLPGAGSSGAGSAPSGDEVGPTETDATRPAGSTAGSTSTTTPATSTSTTSTSTTTSTTTSSTVVTAPPPLPVTVSPDRLLVGPGDVARITGTCPADDPTPGPVVIWEIGATITAVDTGITAADWTYDWRSPAEADVGALQVWCGEPDAWTGGYPAELQIEVVYVSQAVRTGSVAGDGAVRGDPAALPASR